MPPDDDTFDPNDLAEMEQNFNAVLAESGVNDEGSVVVALVIPIDQAAELCTAACSTGYTFDNIPYLLKVALGVSMLTHQVLASAGYDPHTGEKRD